MHPFFLHLFKQYLFLSPATSAQRKNILHRAANLGQYRKKCLGSSNGAEQHLCADESAQLILNI